MNISKQSQMRALLCIGLSMLVSSLSVKAERRLSMTKTGPFMPTEARLAKLKADIQVATAEVSRYEALADTKSFMQIAGMLARWRTIINTNLAELSTRVAPNDPMYSTYERTLNELNARIAIIATKCIDRDIIDLQNKVNTMTSMAALDDLTWGIRHLIVRIEELGFNPESDKEKLTILHRLLKDASARVKRG